ncbi:MAG: LysR family transcriptional regulator [Clostridia bacterium]|nr:LysR family transcriptional regulator [Clostridia bacterium]
MNLQYIRYALEISRTGSISKAAENLSVAQPNLSRAVKELETGLGISIFDRTRTGMTVTPEGERLLTAGEKLLRDVTQLETMFEEGAQPLRSFSVVIPPSYYPSHAFLSYSLALPSDGRFELALTVGDVTEAMDKVSAGDCRLGIIRIPLHFENYYAEKLAPRGLKQETVLEFTPVVVAGLGSPLAGCDTVTPRELSELWELNYVGSPRPDPGANTAPSRLDVTVNDLATRYEILTSSPTAYLYDAPMPATEATRKGLIQRPVATSTRFKDLLISRRDDRLTPDDEAFIRALRGGVRAISGK